MIDAKQVQQLREMSGCGMMECKSALEKAGGDLEKAGEVLRKSGAVKALKKAERSTGQGIVEAYIHAGGTVGVLVTLLCETDFVAKNEEFKKLAHDIALHIAATKPLYVSAEEIPNEIRERELRIYREQAEESGKPKEIIEKILEGKIQTYAQEVSLLEQPFIKDPDKKIKDLIGEHIAKLGENIRVGEFVRYEI